MPGSREENFKEITHFHYMTCMTMPWYKNPCPGGHEIYNFARPLLGYHYYTLLSEREKDFK